MPLLSQADIVAVFPFQLRLFSPTRYATLRGTCCLGQRNGGVTEVGIVGD
jgi:hypothetical protein